MVQSGGDGIARRIIAAIKEQIHGGALKPGDRLPSTRAFAAEWGASRTTITAAWGQLIAEGYLVTRRGARAVVAQGLGPASAAPPRQGGAARAPQLSGFARRLLDLPVPAARPAAQIADLAYGDLSGVDFPALAWRRALNAAALRRPPRLRYEDPRGSPVLRDALHRYLWRARGIRCTPDLVVIVNGSQQGLDLCARLLLDFGSPFVMEDPGYILARHAFLAAGGTAIPVPVDADGLRTDDLPSARLAYVTPSHQFPLGGVLSATRRRALIAWAARSGACIIEDDYDGEYRHDIAPIPPLQALDPDTVVYVGTFSKTLSPTLRLGYVVVPRGLVRAFVAAKQLTDRHTALLDQDALAALLESGAYERHVRGMRARNGARRKALLEVLTARLGRRVTIAGSGAGLHVVARLEGVDPAREPEIIAAARAAGVGLHPLSPLYDPAGPGPRSAGFVLGYAGTDVDTLRRAGETLASVLRRYC